MRKLRAAALKAPEVSAGCGVAGACGVWRVRVVCAGRWCGMRQSPWEVGLWPGKKQEAPGRAFRAVSGWVRPKSSGELWRLLPWWEGAPGLMSGSCTGLRLTSLFLSHRSPLPPARSLREEAWEVGRGWMAKIVPTWGHTCWVVRAGGAELGAGKQPAGALGSWAAEGEAVVEGVAQLPLGSPGAGSQ